MIRNISLRKILITSFTLLVVGTATAVSLLGFHAGRQAIASMAEHLMAQVGERIDQRLAAQLGDLRQVVQTNAALIRQGRLDWRDGPAMERHFAGQLGVFGGVSHLGLVTEQREFRMLVRHGPESLILRRYDHSTGDRLNRYRADRYDEPISLLIFDIDHFRTINDTHGHLEGDQVLVEMTRLVGEHLRASDLLARWGGEEFVILVPQCGLNEARQLAEKLRLLIAGETFSGVGCITSSFGVADYRPPETADAWLDRADQALYDAKVAGRNRVFPAS
jgi:diguanylate cyclase (GGDEF)-like protein